MTPASFLSQIQKQRFEPAYLFLGPEAYRRDLCRRSLVASFLPPEEREDGYQRLDLSEMPLSDVLDDANSLSLFARKRVIWVSSAEAALPRGRGASATLPDEDSEEKKTGGAAGTLAAYLKEPPSETVLVFDSSRYGFDGEDKARTDRIRKFFSAIPTIVEFSSMDPQEARHFARKTAQSLGARIGAAEIDLLVEATGAEASRIANELEKLSLLRGNSPVSADDVAALVPNARETTIFALVNALAKADRKQSLDLLDTLFREGEYLPLALTFLGGLFRFALAAKEQNLRSAQDIENYFRRSGAPMWRSKAEQISSTMSRFSKLQLEKAIRLTFQADRDLKGTRPDDRVILEDFVLKLTQRVV